MTTSWNLLYEPYFCQLPRPLAYGAAVYHDKYRCVVQIGNQIEVSL